MTEFHREAHLSARTSSDALEKERNLGLRLLLKSSLFFKWIKMDLYQIIILRVIHLKRYSQCHIKNKISIAPYDVSSLSKRPLKTTDSAPFFHASSHKTCSGPYADFRLYFRNACACVSPGTCHMLMCTKRTYVHTHTHACVSNRRFCKHRLDWLPNNPRCLN